MKDEKFENQKEIFEALLRGEKITNDHYCRIKFVHLVNDFVVSDDGKSFCGDFETPSIWSIYQEPKPKKTIEVKFYRYHYTIPSGGFFITRWTNYTSSSSRLDADALILKTEERIEIYEVEE